MCPDINKQIYELIAACANALITDSPGKDDSLFLNSLSELVHLTRCRNGEFKLQNNQRELEYLLPVLLKSEIIQSGFGVDEGEIYKKIDFFKEPFKPEDYQEPLLKYLLFIQGKDGVIGTVEHFVKEFKDQLSALDFQRTRTGVMRCFTNIRFAANALRDYGLLRDDYSHLYKKWDITLLGLLVIDEMVKGSLEIKLKHAENRAVPEKYPLAVIISEAIKKFRKTDEVINRLQSIASEPFTGFTEIAKKISSYCEAYYSSSVENTSLKKTRNSMRDKTKDLIESIDKKLEWTLMKDLECLRIQTKPGYVTLPVKENFKPKCLQCDNCGMVFLINLIESTPKGDLASLFDDCKFKQCPNCKKQVRIQ